MTVRQLIAELKQFVEQNPELADRPIVIQYDRYGAAEITGMPSSDIDSYEPACPEEHAELDERGHVPGWDSKNRAVWISCASSR